VRQRAVPCRLWCMHAHVHSLNLVPPPCLLAVCECSSGRALSLGGQGGLGVGSVVSKLAESAKAARWYCGVLFACRIVPHSEISP
jgi:hypothetical protein